MAGQFVYFYRLTLLKYTNFCTFIIICLRKMGEKMKQRLRIIKQNLEHLIWCQYFFFHHCSSKKLLESSLEILQPCVLGFLPNRGLAQLVFYVLSPWFLYILAGLLVPLFAIGLPSKRVPVDSTYTVCNIPYALTTHVVLMGFPVTEAKRARQTVLQATTQQFLWINPLDRRK